MAPDSDGGPYRGRLTPIDLAPVALINTLKDQHPGLRRDSAALALCLHLLLTDTVEPPGRTVPASYELLGQIEGATPRQTGGRNYEALPFLERTTNALRRETQSQIRLVVTPPVAQELARRLRLDGVPDEIEQMASHARHVISIDRTQWRVVRPDGTFKLNTSAEAKKRQELLLSLPTYDNTPPLSAQLQRYLNSLSPQVFSRLKKEAGSAETEKFVHAHYPDSEATGGPGWILRRIQFMAVPIYGPSPKTPRIHARWQNATALPSAVRQDITCRLGWAELDLAHAQLACNARRWNVRDVLGLLERPNYSFWDDLIGWLRKGKAPVSPEDFKRLKQVLKPAVHGLSFGMGKSRIKRFGELKDPEEGIEPDPAVIRVVEEVSGRSFENAGRQLLSHRILRAMLRARSDLYARVQADQGWTDVFGRFLPLEGKANPGSLLAVDTQAMELQVLKRVIYRAIRERETGNPAFTIMLWQHDGFTIKARNRSRLPTVIGLLQRDVELQAERCGIPTRLTVDVGPDCQAGLVSKASAT